MALGALVDAGADLEAINAAVSSLGLPGVRIVAEETKKHGFRAKQVTVEHEPEQRAFLEEVLGLICGLDLRPVAMTGYQREAFVGRDADAGLRVTIDHRIRGRDRDFALGADAENRLIVPARLSVIEFKANERVPYWLTDLTARLNMSVVRVSKYCQGVEAFDRAPRSVFHIPDTDPAGAVPVAAHH